MSAITTFDISHERAIHLLDLYGLLLSRNKRATRSDWSKTFKTLMHWKQSETIHRVSNANALIVLREASGKDPRAFNDESLCYLLKAAIVLGVSAMDSYFHDIIIEKANTILTTRGREANSDLKKLAVGMEEFAKRCDPTERTLALKEALAVPLGYESFQSASKIAKGLRYIGLTGPFWGDVASKLFMSETDLVTRLDEIADRRNQIAHEGDLLKNRRSGDITERPIQEAWTRDALKFIRDVVFQSDNVVAIRVP